MIQVLHNEALKNRHTFGIATQSAILVETDNQNELLAELYPILPKNKNFLIMGEGSNLLFTKNYPGLIIHPVNQEKQQINQSKQSVIIETGAGLNWDKFVDWCIKEGWFGLENLSGIPGSVGAVPVQNIGAYGTEAADFITEVLVVDLNTKQSFWVNSNECQFGYRDSIFKKESRSSWLVWKVRFRLQTTFHPNLNYQVLRDSLNQEQKLTASLVRQAVLQIRESKLPDPVKIGNAGSFFKNPVISPEKTAALLLKYPDLPHYPCGDNQSLKISAGWLIEKAGLKGYRHKNAGVYGKQALVLVNHGKATGQEVEELAEMIRDKIKDQFGIILDPEVKMI